MQKPATSATDFYESCATAEAAICAIKNAFSGETFLVDDKLTHIIIKAGNMDGNNDNNTS